MRLGAVSRPGSPWEETYEEDQDRAYCWVVSHGRSWSPQPREAAGRRGRRRGNTELQSRGVCTMSGRIRPAERRLAGLLRLRACTLAKRERPAGSPLGAHIEVSSDKGRLAGRLAAPSSSTARSAEPCEHRCSVHVLCASEPLERHGFSPPRDRTLGAALAASWRAIGLTVPFLSR